MKRSKRIYILLGVLAVVCLATFAAIKFEERQEQIRTSEEVILELATEEVQSLRWSYDDTALSFTRNESGSWRWDEDDAFPVSEGKMNELLELFSSFSVSFVIEDVEDYSQYGLDTPACTIELATTEQEYTLTLGDFSKLDSQRYVSIGDGNAYLVSTDPMETYEIIIRDMIEHDELPDYDTVTALTFTGSEDRRVNYQTESNRSICAEDVYFTDGLPLDTGAVEDYLDTLSGLSLTNYVTYNATAAELQSYGLDEPELTVTVDYTTPGEDDQVVSGSYTVRISRSAEDRAADGTEDEEDTYAAYVWLDNSPIVYQLSASEYEKLMAAGYDDLRHREVFTADFGQVTSMDITLDGVEYALTTLPDEEDEDTLVWYFGENEADVTGVQDALESLTADEFTSGQPEGRQEIALTLHLDNAVFPQLKIALYRYDGTSCLAVVDGTPFALIPRSEVVDLMEAVNAIVLN